MVKKKSSKKTNNNIILIILIIILSVTNIFLLVTRNTTNQESTITEEVLFKETNKKYNREEKYYASIKYKKFNSLWKSKDISTVAVVDNSSTSYKKFKELINKLSYYKNTKIYLLETSKLSKKDEIKFFEKDSRLKELETNYIITISDKKIITITTFDNTELNKLIEGIGE